MNIAIYTNILTPYRTYFYNLMYEECRRHGDNFHVILMSDTESNRNWTYDDFKSEYTILLNHKTLSYGETYIHYNNNLVTVLKELKLDVIICAGSYLCPGIWTALKYEKKLGYKTFFWSESHLNEARNYSVVKEKIRELLRKTIYKKFDGFWYAGILSKKFIETYCKSTADFFFVPNLVEEEKYKRAMDVSEEQKKGVRKKYNVDKQKKVFVCPARLSHVKGIDSFLPVLAKSNNKHMVTLLVAGNGELKDKIQSQAKSYNLDVRLLGFQCQENIIELYSIADVFLLPSLSDPNPLTCIEALWAGLPLFISEHCGNYPEVVKQGENGYSFNYHDIDKAIQNLDAICLADSNWIKKAREVSRNIAFEKYYSKNVVNRILTEMRKTD